MTQAITFEPSIRFTSPRDPLAIHREFTRIAPGIEGWFYPGAVALWDSLLTFQRSRDVRGHMLEIGVWHGKSAALLAMHGEPFTRLHLVDNELRVAELTRTMEAAPHAAQLEILPIEGDSRRLHVHPMMVECFQEHRWFHIDGEHSARAVSNDLSLANALVSPQGIVVVDDFFSWVYPQVTEAVFRYVRDNPDDFALFLSGYNKAYLARPHFVHEYLRYCAEGLHADMTARGVECTIAKTTYPAEMNTFGIGPKFQGHTLRGPDWDDRTIRY